MRPGGGKGKGSSFERKIAKQLSLWLTDGTDSTQLVRSVLSGGWKDRGKRQGGDLAANGPEGEEFRKHFIVECKHHNQDLLWRLFTSEGGVSLQGWWKKLSAEAAEADQEPLLIFRQNGKPVMIALRRRTFRPKAEGVWVQWHVPGLDFVVTIVRFEDFLRTSPLVYYRTLRRGS